MVFGLSEFLKNTCGIGVNLYKQWILAQSSTQEERSDVMSCFFHGLQNMTRTELKQEMKTWGE